VALAVSFSFFAIAVWYSTLAVSIMNLLYSLKCANLPHAPEIKNFNSLNGRGTKFFIHLILMLYFHFYQVGICYFSCFNRIFQSSSRPVSSCFSSSLASVSKLSYSIQHIQGLSWTRDVILQKRRIMRHCMSFYPLIFYLGELC